MWPIQFWIKQRVPSGACHHGRHHVTVTRACVSALARWRNWSVVSYINHQGGLVSKRLCTLANNLLVWAQTNLHSLKAMHVPGKMNHGADMFSRNNVSSGEWRVREQRHKLILIAPLWRNQPWVSELFQLLEVAPWSIPLRWDILSQANGTLWHPQPLERAPIWTIVIHEPQSTLVKNRPAASIGIGQASRRPAGPIHQPSLPGIRSNASKVVLKARLGHVPKVLSTPLRAQVIAFSALSPLTGSQELSLLCPVRALRVYIERSASNRKSE